MSGYRAFLERVGRPKKLTLADHRACLWMERHGFTFGVLFGWANAREKARQARAGYLKPYQKIRTREKSRRRVWARDDD